jgi:plastocyanin
MKLLAVLCILLLLAGCAGTTDSTSSSTTAAGTTQTGSTSGPAPGGTTPRKVDLEDNHFEDGNLTLTKGATISYVNAGMHDHTVTVHWVGEPVTTLRLDRTLRPGEAVSFTFADAGTYHVWCRFHGTMTSGMATVVKAT